MVKGWDGVMGVPSSSLNVDRKNKKKMIYQKKSCWAGQGIVVK